MLVPQNKCLVWNYMEKVNSCLEKKSIFVLRIEEEE